MFDKSGSKKRGGGRDRSRSPVNRRQPFDNQPRGGGGMGNGPGPMFNAGPPSYDWHGDGRGPAIRSDEPTRSAASERC